MRGASAPEMSLHVSYDDVDLDISPVTNRELASLPALAEQIQDHLNTAPLKDVQVTRIVIGMVRIGDCWEEPHSHDVSAVGSHFWGISLEGHRQITHIYDVDTGLLARCSYRVGDQ